jgi:hypothetical protein
VGAAHECAGADDDQAHHDDADDHYDDADRDHEPHISRAAYIAADPHADGTRPAVAVTIAEPNELIGAQIGHGYTGVP